MRKQKRSCKTPGAFGLPDWERARPMTALVCYSPIMWNISRTSAHRTIEYTTVNRAAAA